MADTMQNLVEVKNLKKYFELRKGFINKKVNYVKAVDNISLSIKKGETFGLVGESGCGKTTVGRTIIKLYEPTSGQVIYDGKDLSEMDDKDMLPYRKKMQMIFQDPYASLDPRMTVGEIIGEPLNVHKIYEGKERADRIRELIKISWS